MIHHGRLWPMIAVTSLGLLATPGEASSLYRLTDLGASPLGQTYTDARSIYDPNSVNGYVEPLVSNSGSVSYGGLTNNAGPYSITYQPVYSPHNNYEYSNILLHGPGDQTTTINLYGTPMTVGMVSSSGSVVGWVYRGDVDGYANNQAFVYKPTPGKDGVIPNNISYVSPGVIDSIPGAYYNTPMLHAFGINKADQIVGDGYHYLITQDQGPFPRLTRAMISDGQTTTDLNTLLSPGSGNGWLLTSATSINDSGLIAGYGLDPAGHVHGYLLTPTATPEPSTLAIVAVGLAGLLLRWRGAGSIAGPTVATGVDELFDSPA